MLLSSRIFFFIVRHKIMLYILYIFMSGRRAVEGRERWEAGQQQEGCRKGVSRGAARGRQVPQDWSLAQCRVGLEWVRGGVKHPDICKRDESGRRRPRAESKGKEGWLEQGYCPGELCPGGTCEENLRTVG